VYRKGEDGWNECGHWSDAKLPAGGIALALSSGSLAVGWIRGMCTCPHGHCTCNPARTGPGRHPTPILALR
jgi:hypothetical protein